MKIENASELIISKEYVREPVDKAVNKILESKKRRIILSGNRGTGRTTVLHALQNRGLGTKEQTIYMHPEAIIFMEKEPTEQFNEELFDYIYEQYFAHSILCYIKRNYPLTYEKYFKKDKEALSKAIDEFDEQLNNCWYIETTFKTSKEPEKILKRTLYKMYDKLNIDKLNIAIDGFDKINGSSKYAQKVYERNFHRFDKTIIVSNDPKLKKENLNNSEEYDIQKLTYGKNKDVLREIIRRRMSEDKEKADLYTQDIFINKLAKLGENITFTLEVLAHIDRRLSWCEQVNDIEKIIDEVTIVQKEKAKELKKIIKPPTLYL